MRLLIVTQIVDREDPVLGFFHRWLDEFARQCEHVHVICLNEGEHELPENVVVHSLGKEEGAGKLTYLWRFYRYLVTLRRQYDDVFVHMNPEYVILGAPLWRLWGKHVALWYTHKSVTLKLRLAEKLADTIFTASRESFRLPSEKVQIMGHGIDIEALKPLDVPRDEVFRIVSLGRISPSKQYEVLIEATAMLDDAKRPFRVHVIGRAQDGEDYAYLKKLQQLVWQKNLSDVVSFEGGVAHHTIYEWLSRADCFINLSTTGSLDKAVLEAMAMRVPVITSNEAFSTMLAGVDGRLLAPEDPAALKERIEYIAGLSPDQRKALGAHLREVVVQEHSLTPLISRLVESLSK